jgi:nitroreductase
VESQNPLHPIDRLGHAKLLEALFARRSRRFGLGMEIPFGPLAYRSAMHPMALSDLERDALVLCGAGISGWTSGIEYASAEAGAAGCNHALRMAGRTFPSAGGGGAAEILFTDDSGTWITQFRDVEPARWNELAAPGGFAGMIQRSARHRARLSDKRAELKPIAIQGGLIDPWYFDRPGSAILVPILDLTQSLLNRLAIALGSGITVRDSAGDRSFSAGQPSGAGGTVELALVERHVLENAAGEAAIICHNIALAAEAIGLGCCMFSPENPEDLAAAFSSEAFDGRGIRFADDAKGVAAAVGIDGVFETMRPPYTADMRAAVEKVIELKFGPGGAYDPYGYRGPYRNSWRIKVETQRYGPALIRALADLAEHIWGTYRRFPSILPPLYLRAGVQVHHLDPSFYEKFFGADACLKSHRDHMQNWHAET